MVDSDISGMVYCSKSNFQATTRHKLFELRFYTDKTGNPLVGVWLKSLPLKAQAKGYKLLQELKSKGNQLRRPQADFLRDGIYELRWEWGSVQYRILYFFYGHKIVVVSHGIVKEGHVPDAEIETAITRKKELKEKQWHEN